MSKNINTSVKKPKKLPTRFREEPGLPTRLKRVSRPSGTTFLALKYQENGSTQNKEKLENHIVHYYTLNGLTIDNKPTDIYALASYLQMTPSDVMNRINQVGKQLQGFSDPNQFQNTLQSLLTLSTTWAIQDKGQINSQVEILKSSQDNQYKPFISSALNQALKLNLDANKNVLDLIKTILPNQSTNILSTLLDNSDTNKDNISYLTQEQALLLIQSNENTIQEHGLNALPSSFQEQEQGTNTISEQPDGLPVSVGNNETTTLPSTNGILNPTELQGLYQDYALAKIKSCNPRSARPALQPVATGVEPSGLIAKKHPKMALKHPSHTARNEVLGPLNELYEDTAEATDEASS